MFCGPLQQSADPTSPWLNSCPLHAQQCRTRMSRLWNELSARMSRRDTYSGRRSMGSRYLAGERAQFMEGVEQTEQQTEMQSQTLQLCRVGAAGCTAVYLPTSATHQVWQGTLMTIQPQARSRRRRIMVCPSGELVLTAKWKGPSTSMAILRSGAAAGAGWSGSSEGQAACTAQIPLPVMQARASCAPAP